jgi:hypothetical protein
MPYAATAVKVMTASPGDVAHERQIIRDVIHEWNSINSEASELVLMPVGWESHASPKMGHRAQALINEQVLRTCDLLVAVFWTRLGSPTGDSPSGTVEEIREHVQAGKPAMLYFSQQPVRPDSVDDAQYKALHEFRNECQAGGLIEIYESIAEFREKFARQLALTVQREFSKTGAVSPEPLQGRRPEISADAAELLAEAVQDSTGSVLRLLPRGEVLAISTNRRNMVDRGSRQSAARWDSALQELVRLELLRQSDPKGEVFVVTHAGYDAAAHLTDQTS